MRKDRQYDYLTVKYDPDGNESWVALYNGAADAMDRAAALELDSYGNVYVTGWSEGTATDEDFATIKYDPDGNELWVARYDGPANYKDVPYGMALDPSGNVCVTGLSEGTATDEDFATIKYDPDGNQLWIARYDGPANTGDVPYGIAVDVSGNTYVTGYSTGSTTGRTMPLSSTTRTATSCGSPGTTAQQARRTWPAVWPLTAWGTHMSPEGATMRTQATTSP